MSHSIWYRPTDSERRFLYWSGVVTRFNHVAVFVLLSAIAVLASYVGLRHLIGYPASDHDFRVLLIALAFFGPFGMVNAFCYVFRRKSDRERHGGYPKRRGVAASCPRISRERRRVPGRSRRYVSFARR